MGALDDFVKKDMIEQIMILNEIKDAGQTEAIPELFDLLAHPLGDHAVDEMVYHILFELLAGQESRIVAGLKHQSEKVRLLCIRRAGESKPALAVPILLELLKTEKDDAGLVGEIVRVLGKYKDPAFFDTLLPYVESEDPTVAAWAMQSLLILDGQKTLAVLKTMVEARDQVLKNSGECDLTTASALQAMAAFSDQDTIGFLISRIHHPNPMLRKCVLAVLASIGEVILPALEKCLTTGDKDEKIMAANLIGMLGVNKCADVLAAALEPGPDLEPNLRFAIYEALGRISSLRSVITLADNLKEQDELVLMAVVAGLENLYNAVIAKRVNEVLARGDMQGSRLIKAILAARAVKLFRGLYDSETHYEALMKPLLETQDIETRLFFQGVLENIAGERAAADVKRLKIDQSPALSRRILFADDSKAMLYFYKSVCADLNVEAETVEDGRKAFEYLQSGGSVDLLVTDLNMPEMDGIELVRKIREVAEWADLYILMATTESEKSQTDLASQAGVNEFISKPFTKEVLKGTLQKRLNIT